MDAAYIFALAKHRYTVNMKSFDDLILRKPAILRGNEKHFVSGFSEVFAEKISYPSAAATHRWKLVVQHQDTHNLRIQDRGCKMQESGM